jgi:hypothetical protein
VIPLSYPASAALLADDRPALLIGEVIGTLLFPAVGVLLLVLGLRERSKARRAQPPGYPGFPPYPPPGYPPSYPVGYPPSGYPPAPPPRPTAGQGMIIAGVIVTILGLLGAGVSVLNSVNDRKAAENTSPPVKVGQCITGEAMASGRIGAHDIVACSQPAGVFEVVSTGRRDAPCPDGGRDDTDFARSINDVSSVCFIPNLLAGQCYANVKHGLGDHNRTDTIKPVECTDTSAEFKVLQRFEKADYDLCPVGSHQRI